MKYLFLILFGLIIITEVKSQSEKKISKHVFQIEQITEEIILTPEIIKIKITPVDAPLENNENIKTIFNRGKDSIKIDVKTLSLYEIRDSNVIIDIETFPQSGRWVMRKFPDGRVWSTGYPCPKPEDCQIPIYEKIVAKYKKFSNIEFFNLNDKFWVEIPQEYLITYCDTITHAIENENLEAVNCITRDVCISLIKEEVIPAEIEIVKKNIVTYSKGEFRSKLHEEEIEDSGIIIIQKILKEKGFYDGDLDGIVTNQLNEGLANYQYSIKENINSFGQLLESLKLF